MMSSNTDKIMAMNVEVAILQQKILMLPEGSEDTSRINGYISKLQQQIELLEAE